MPENITQLQKELETVIKGKKTVTDKIIMAVLARGHILLEDVPGVGKTTTALALSRLMGMEFNRIQFTPDVVPSDVTGFTMYEKQTGQFMYRPGAVMCNLMKCHSRLWFLRQRTRSVLPVPRCSRNPSLTVLWSVSAWDTRITRAW